MFDASELRGRIAKSGLSQRKVAKQMGITPKTFYCKMRSGGFQVAELDRIAEIIGMKRSEIGQLFCEEQEVS